MMALLEAIGRLPDAVWLALCAFLFAICCDPAALNLRRLGTETNRRVTR